MRKNSKNQITNASNYNFGTNTRNRARPRTYAKLWSAKTRTDLDGPMIIVDSEPPPFFMTY